MSSLIYHNNMYINVAKYLGIKDFNPENEDYNFKNLRDLFRRLNESSEYDSLHKEFIVRYNNVSLKYLETSFKIIEFILTSDKVSDFDKKCLLSIYITGYHTNIFYEIYRDELDHSVWNNINSDHSDTIQNTYKIFVDKFMMDWIKSDNGYIRFIAVNKLIKMNFSNSTDFFSINNLIRELAEKTSENDTYTTKNGINHIEYIARSIVGDNEIYKILMIHIMDYAYKYAVTEEHNYEKIQKRLNDENKFNVTLRNNVYEAIIKKLNACTYDLLYYNKESDNAFDVMVRGFAYSNLIKRIHNLAKAEKYFSYCSREDYDKVHESIHAPVIEEDFFDFNYTTFYVYVEEDVFYECYMNENKIYHKIGEHAYLVPSYYINSVCYDRDWFKNHPDEEFIRVDETPCFEEESYSNSMEFDMAFNSDPNFFDEADIIYDSKEAAKEAFMKSKNNQ